MNFLSDLDQEFPALVDLLSRIDISDILINSDKETFIDTAEGLLKVENIVRDAQHLKLLIQKMTVMAGRSIDASKPFLDGRLPDESRFHIILPPLSLQGPIISVRKTVPRAYPLESFCPPTLSDWLEKQILAKKNFLICGSTGSGKTSLLRSLLEKALPVERLIILEETREILLRGRANCVNLEARPANADGKGEVTLRQLFKNALRMRPDRLVVGECRGDEVFELIQALNTGHKGSLCTLHANSCLDGLRRIEGLCQIYFPNLQYQCLKDWIGNSIEVVVFVTRKGASRHIAEVIEIKGLEGAIYRYSPIYKASN